MHHLLHQSSKTNMVGESNNSNLRTKSLPEIGESSEKIQDSNLTSDIPQNMYSSENEVRAGCSGFASDLGNVNTRNQGRHVSWNEDRSGSDSTENYSYLHDSGSNNRGSNNVNFQMQQDSDSVGRDITNILAHSSGNFIEQSFNAPYRHISEGPNIASSSFIPQQCLTQNSQINHFKPNPSFNQPMYNDINYMYQSSSNMCHPNSNINQSFFVPKAQPVINNFIHDHPFYKSQQANLTQNFIPCSNVGQNQNMNQNNFNDFQVVHPCHNNNNQYLSTCSNLNQTGPLNYLPSVRPPQQAFINPSTFHHVQTQQPLVISSGNQIQNINHDQFGLPLNFPSSSSNHSNASETNLEYQRERSKVMDQPVPKINKMPNQFQSSTSNVGAKSSLTGKIYPLKDRSKSCIGIAKPYSKPGNFYN